MARAATVAFVAVLIGVALLPVRSYLTEPREVIASTPSAFTGIDVPIPVPAGKEACADEILFATDGEVARFAATAPQGRRAPLLEVAARGYTSGPYQNGYESKTDVPGGWRGTRVLDVPIDPPRRDG